MKLVIVPAALAELRAITAYYEQFALGRAFVDEFERAADLVLANPSLGSAFANACRRYSLRRFPYKLIYQVKDPELRIVAVAHHRRRPGYWIK